MPGVLVDGNDLPAVAAAAATAIGRARRGEGPSLIECKTYRLRGHSKSDRNLYRTKEEIESWRRRDPIVRLEQEILANDRLATTELEAIARRAMEEIAAALDFALASPDPDVEELTRDVYAA
jgi:pyruvate dehydrogenase E1 component alpha subunit